MLLDIMKSLDAPIEYNRTLKSFQYAAFFKLDIEVTIKTITLKEAKTIYGGSLLKKHCSVLFVGRSKPKLAVQNETVLQAELTA
jgi:hypothetical protein